MKPEHNFRMKQLTRHMFTSGEALSKARKDFFDVIRIDICSAACSVNRYTCIPDTSKATYMDFYHALDYRPNECSVEAMALVLFRMQMEGSSSRDLAAHHDAMLQYWQRAA